MNINSLYASIERLRFESEEKDDIKRNIELCLDSIDGEDAKNDAMLDMLEIVTGFDNAAGMIAKIRKLLPGGDR